MHADIDPDKLKIIKQHCNWLSFMLRQTAAEPELLTSCSEESQANVELRLGQYLHEYQNDCHANLKDPH